MADVMGALLAGGASTRMGEDKAEVVVGGRSMGQWVAEAMRLTFSRTLVVGRQTDIEGLPAVPDLGRPHTGPLSGLVTALTTLEAPVVLVAVDQPLVRAETLRRLAELVGDDPVVCIDDVEQVTCAAYPPTCAVVAAEELSTGGSIRSMLRRIPVRRIEEPLWRSWGEDGRSWFSMDSPDDIVRAEQRFRLNLLG